MAVSGRLVSRTESSPRNGSRAAAGFPAETGGAETIGSATGSTGAVRGAPVRFGALTFGAGSATRDERSDVGRHSNGDDHDDTGSAGAVASSVGAGAGVWSCAVTLVAPD